MVAITPWQRRFYHDEAADSSDPRRFVGLDHLTWRRALLIGLMQCIAMWPGTSRSMITIVGGMLAGMKPRQAAEFSFLLALPTLGGASLYRLAKSVAGGEVSMVTAFGWPALLLALAVATVSAALAIKWLVAYLTRHGLAVFGWYRLVVAALFALLAYNGMLGAWTS
jgi:undecaprenyl-diphosphatase